MKRGFTDLAARSIIPEYPGETAEVYAREALDGSEGMLSQAEDPVRSLAETLAKQVRDGREKRVMRKRIGSVPELLEPRKLIEVKYRYFPQEVMLYEARPGWGNCRNCWLLHSLERGKVVGLITQG